MDTKDKLYREAVDRRAGEVAGIITSLDVKPVTRLRGLCRLLRVGFTVTPQSFSRDSIRIEGAAAPLTILDDIGSGKRPTECPRSISERKVMWAATSPAKRRDTILKALSLIGLDVDSNERTHHQMKFWFKGDGGLGGNRETATCKIRQAMLSAGVPAVGLPPQYCCDNWTVKGPGYNVEVWHVDEERSAAFLSVSTLK